MKTCAIFTFEKSISLSVCFIFFYEHVNIKHYNSFIKAYIVGGRVGGGARERGQEKYYYIWYKYELTTLVILEAIC